MFKPFSVVLFVLSTNVQAAESPQQIIAHMREAYASLRSYSDTGVVLNHMTEGEPPNQTAFRSAFVRPHLFRFAWVTHHPYPPLRHITHSSVIWSNNTGAYAWSDRSGKDAAPQKKASIALAVAGATGVSLGAAHTIASLLLPDADVGAPMLEKVTSLELAGVEPFEGAICYRLVGQHAVFGSYEVLIGKEDYLLRKATRRVRGALHEEIRRDIRINAEIAEQDFTSEK